ncbi:class IIb bacteriocin, lactobin A/cerein 7B family [Aquimarina gracilis]|uniref:Class IIb bacteriocin, lactobin A/cerein 7B family n=1 Tax=Aquimarina gracilis TaxID=874422 RepID=A0ABU6A1H5_9FLAO|nr:class IIb bacteriocin, lactobin A/cerein 7B family [Aquimarina gracilis]MEB3348013.1 class IIb bacteriocin, lactobin A/cerein 7B family [Aquimarina gracilis]
MRNLKLNEITNVSGGILPAVVGAIVAVAGVLTAGHAVGEIIGEAAQREHEANHQCSSTD